MHESVAESVGPLVVTIGKGAATVTKTAKARVGNADILDTVADAIMLGTNDGSCPPGTVGMTDFGSGMVGQPNTGAVGPASQRGASVPLTLNAGAFATRNKKSPARCRVVLTAAGPAGDSDATNNVTRLVIDVIDKNDF